MSYYSAVISGNEKHSEHPGLNKLMLIYVNLPVPYTLTGLGLILKISNQTSDIKL